MFCVCAAEHGVHARQDRCSAVLSPVQGLHCLCPRAAPNVVSSVDIAVAAAAFFRHRNLTQGTTAPASASRRRQRRRVCPVAVAVFARRGRGDPSPQLLQCGQGARRFRRAGLACAPRDEVPASAVVTVVCRRQRRQQGQRRRLSKEGRERRDNALKLVRNRGHGRGAEAERRAPLVSLSSPEGVSRDCLFWRSVSFVF